MTRTTEKARWGKWVMNIVGMGPHVLVPEKPDAPIRVQVLDYGSSVPQVETKSETATEESVTQDHEKSRFSKIYDLLHEAEKKKKKDGARRRQRICREYKKLKDPHPQQVIGTLYTSSV